jgi:DNA-directed RNA polymerase omega subunit
MEIGETMATKLDKCLEQIPSRFALATVASKRWEQLMQGGRPMVESQNPRSINVVFSEISTGKLALNMEEKTIEKLGTPIPLPPTPPPEPLPPPSDNEGEAA